jgi:hypothetical protein
MISVKESCKVVQMVYPGKGTGPSGSYSSGDNAESKGTVVDTKGFNEAVFSLVGCSKGLKKNATVSIRESSNATGGTGGFTAITDGIGDSTSASFSTIAFTSGNTTRGLLQLDLRNRARYLKAYLVMGTGARYLLSLEALLGSPKTVQPVSQTALTTAT